MVLLSGCGSSHSTPAATTTTGPALSTLANKALSGCVLSDYFVSMELGTQVFDLLVDSGSTTTAVAASDCSNCNITPSYTGAVGVKQSGSAEALYGDNSGWNGSIWLDNMQVLGNDSTELTPQVKARFAAMDSQTSFFTATSCTPSATVEYQGILGLGPNDLLQKGTDSFLSAVAASKQLAHDAFAVQMCDLDGHIWFGGYEESSVTGQPFFAPLVTDKTTTGAEYYYAVDVESLAVAGQDVGLTSSDLGPMIVDTGTSGLYLTSSGFKALNQRLQASAGFKANFPANLLTSGNCYTAAKATTREALDAALPTLTLGIRGEDGTGQLTLNASESYLMVSHLEGSDSLLYCPVVAATKSVPIIGASAMRRHVVIFDRDNARVGFAPQTTCGTELPEMASQAQ